MAEKWRIDHAEPSPGGFLNVCKVSRVDVTGAGPNEKVRVLYSVQLSTAFPIPPPGPERNAAIDALKAQLPTGPPERPDMTAIETLLNTP